MFDSNCLLQVLELSFSGWNRLLWANAVSVINFLSSPTRGEKKRGDETENPEHPQMGNPNPEIVQLPKEMKFWGTFVGGAYSGFFLTVSKLKKRDKVCRRCFAGKKERDGYICIFTASTALLKSW